MRTFNGVGKLSDRLLSMVVGRSSARASGENCSPGYSSCVQTCARIHLNCTASGVPNSVCTTNLNSCRSQCSRTYCF